MGIVEPGPGESEQSKGTGGVGKTGSAFEKVRDAGTFFYFFSSESASTILILSNSA